MRHQILIPTDFSDNAWSAALYAIKLYAKVPCTFYFSHTWTFLNTGTRTYISPSYIDPLKDKVKNQLAAFKERAQAESSNPEHEFKTIYGEGELWDTVEMALRKHAIDLVVMGTKGATGAKKLLFGSNAVTVLNKMKRRPVMLVPNKCEYVAPKSIVFPTDFNRSYGTELDPLKELAELHGGIIDVLHIQGKEELTDVQNQNLEILKEALKNHEHRFNWMGEYDKKANAIMDFVAENDVNILNMINYEHSFIENLTKEPIVKRIGFNSTIPFLVVPRR